MQRLHRLGCLAIAIPLLAAAPALAQDPGAEEERSGPIDWTRWTPSISIGAAFGSRGTEASVDAAQGGMNGDESLLCKQPTVSLSWPNCIDARTPAAVEDFADSRDSSIDGFSLPLSAQLLTPPIESLPGSPRPFVQAGYYFFLGDTPDTLAGDGPQPEDFNKLRQDNTRPLSRLRIELLGEPKSRWFAGAGVAFRLPVDSYEVYLKPSVNYAEERIDVTGQITSTVADPPPISTPTGVIEFNKTNAFVDTQVLREISLGLGLDVLIGKLGPMGVGLSFDLFASIPVSGGETSFEVANPCDKGGCNPAGSGAFSADIGQTQFLGSVGLRLSWLGE